jgi:hypothetical protein
MSRTSCIVFILLILLSSCIKERFDPNKLDTSVNLNTGLAIPVGFSHLEIEKYLKDAKDKNELIISKDGFLSLYFSADIVNGIMSDLLSFPQITAGKTILNQTGSAINLQLPGESQNLTDSVLIPVSLIQATGRIDSIRLLSGNLGISLTSSNLSGTITYQFPDLLLKGVPFSHTAILSNSAFTLSLADYTIKPLHDASGNNFLKCKISIILQSPSGPVNNGSTLLDIGLDLNSLNFATLYGDFGGNILSLPTFRFNTTIFNRISGGSFEFADPILKLLFNNSAGVPLGLSFSLIDGIDRNLNHFPLTGSGIPTLSDPKIIGFPSLSQIGLTVKDSLILNKTNSNLEDMLASNPDSIRMNATVGINHLPGGGTTFINHDSRYNVTAALELPLWGKGKFITILDTLAFGYIRSTLPAQKELDHLIVRINFVNTFPVTVYPQVYMLDANKIVIDSLFTGNEKIEGATDVNGDGKADPHVQGPLDVDLPKSKIDNLYKTNFLLSRGTIMTTNFPLTDVKFYDSYYIDYNIGLIAQLKISTGK